MKDKIGKKRIFSVILAVAFVISIMPMYSKSVHADGGSGSHIHDGFTFTEWDGTGLTEKGDKIDVLKAGHYCLSQDVNRSKTLEINGDVYICLNGHKIYRESGDDFSIINIPSGATLNLYDCSNNHDGKITGGTGKFGTLSSSSTYYGGGVYIESGGVLNMYGGNITGNKKSTDGIVRGAGIYMDGGTVNMRGGNVSDNVADDAGGGVYINNGTFNMYGGSITENKAINTPGKIGYGGGININGGTFNMYGGSISENEADSGGGVYLTGTGKFNMKGGTISLNESKISCGGVDMAENGGSDSGDKFVMTGGQIIENEGKVGGINAENSITIGGNAVVKGNVGSESKACNVFLKEGKYIVLGKGEYVPKDGMKVYVTTTKVVDGYKLIPSNEVGEIIVNEGAKSEFAKYFACDNSERAVKYVNDQLVLGDFSQPYYYPPTQSTNTSGIGTIAGGDGTGTSIDVSIKNDEIIINNISASAINNAANANTSGREATSIVIDLSQIGNIGNNITKLTIPKSVVEEIVKALNSSSNNKDSLIIKTKNAIIKIDSIALASIASQAKAENIQLVIENKTLFNLNASQKTAIDNLTKAGGKKVLQIFEVYFLTGDDRIKFFGGGEVFIGKIDFDIPAGMNAKYFHIYYIPESGDLERHPTWVEDGSMFFRTTHFSYYAIVYDESIENGQGSPVYRLFNNKSGDHLLTGNAKERDNVTNLGYVYEGIAFYTSDRGKKVYRLFNNKTGEHFYTASESEKERCVNAGWKLEGVAFTTDGISDIYRLYNGKVHHYTTSNKEANYLLKYGWVAEKNEFKAY